MSTPTDTATQQAVPNLSEPPTTATVPRVMTDEQAELQRLRSEREWLLLRINVALGFCQRAIDADLPGPTVAREMQHLLRAAGQPRDYP